MLTLFGILKGLLIQQESDRTKEFTLEVDPSASTDTRTTLKSKQTDDRVLELPDTSGELVEKDFAQVLTQKEIDADLNTILNIDNDEIKALAGIDATKIADGSVDNTEFQALNGIESNIQDQLDTKVTATGLIDNRLIKADGTQDIQASGITVDDSNNMTGVLSLDVGTISSSGIDNNGQTIENVADPVNQQDAATKKYVDDNIIAGGANQSLSNLVAPVQPNESFDFQGANTITGLPTPVNPSDVATKDYVDSSSSASRIVTGSYSSPILVDEITPIAIAGNSDEDIYVEGTAGQLEFGSWVTYLTGQTSNYQSIAHSPTLDLYVSVKTSGDANPFIYSADGETWTNATHDLSNNGMFYTVIWVPEYNKFFAAGYESAGGYRVCESSDGMTWTTSYAQASGSTLNDICYSPTLDLLVGHAVAGFYVISEDGGATWTTYSETVSSAGYYSCVWAEELGIFVAVGDPASFGDPGVKISEDGFTWTPATTVLEGFQRQKIVYSSTLERFVAMSENNNTLPFKLMWSDDGENWNGISLPVVNYLAQDIVWSSYHEVFIVISATDNSFFWSYDGITWYQNVISPAFSETPGAIGINETNGIAVILCNGTESQINTTIGANASTFATIADGNIEGQRLTLIGTNSAQQVVLNNGTNILLTEQIKLANHKIVQLRWNDDASLWINYPSVGNGSSESSGGVNSTLSNLTAPTAVNQSLIPGSALLDLGGVDDPWANVFANNINNVNGDNLHIQANDAFAIQMGTFADVGFGVSGGIDIRTGSAQNAIGDIQIIGGNSVDSNGGNITISSGDSTNANAGGVDIGTGSSSSGNPGRVKILNNALFTLSTLSADPAGAEAGAIYFNTSSNKFRGFDGSIWTDLN